MNRVFVAQDPIEASFVKDLLERAGISAEVQGEFLFGLRPEIGSGITPMLSTTQDRNQTACRTIAVPVPALRVIAVAT